MVRFCDNIRIYRHGGNIYDPFANGTEAPPNNDENGIYRTLVYDGECKAELKSQNSMMSVSDRGTYRIYINENDIDADARDVAYLQTNGEGDELKLTILEVKHYEHNTIIHAIRLKDGENE